MKRKKALGAIILGAMLLSMIACGEQDTQTPMSDTVPATEEVTTAETEPAYTLPEKDMAGWTLSIMNSTEDSLTWANTRITVTEQDGDVLNDAIFNRNADLMEKYNFTLSVEEIPFSNIPATLKKNVMAGDDVYQIYSMNEGAIASYLSNIADWNNIPGMNLDDIWWNPNATSVYNIAGKQTALAGNMTLSAVSRAVCMVFNKNIWTQYGDPDVNLYSLVENHAWTVDRYLEIASSVSADLNGDGKMDVNDLYGLNMGRGFKGYIGFFLTSAGVRFTKEIDGVQTFTLISDEIGINLMTKLVDAMEQVGYYYNEDTSVDSFAPSDFFKNGHALFTQGVPHDIYKLRDMNDDIGILPMPMLDENQNGYKTASCGGAVWTLSKTYDESHAEDIGIVLDAMSCLTYHDIIPVYKELALKTKTARDNESAEMLDIIWSDLFFDFGTNIMYDAVLAPTFLKTIWNKKSSDVIVSSMVSAQKKIENMIDSIYEQAGEIE